MQHYILAINPGSTSTKVGVFIDEHLRFKEVIEHPDIDRYESILAQKDMRLAAVLDSVRKNGFDLRQFSAVVGRGGILPPVQTGGYEVNQRLKELLMSDRLAPHASNLGGILADEVAQKAGGIPAFIYDAVSANEFPQLAQVTGLPEIRRTSFCHVLNSRAVAIRFAQSLGKSYSDLNLLVAHLGGGITISAHDHGRIVDSLADDNGPFAPERAGALPLLDFIELCYSGKYSKEELKRLVRGGGGLKAHTGTSDIREIERRMQEGDDDARLVLEAQVYQIAKGIGLLAPVFKGRCDAILLTGGLAKSEYIARETTEYVRFIAPVTVIPGEFELEALAEGALRILRGQEPAHVI